jgi:hypothetical protein
LWLQKNGSIEIDFGFLVVTQTLVGLSSSHQDFDLQSVLFREGLGVSEEIIKQLEGLGRILYALFIVLSHHVNQANICYHIFIERIDFKTLIVEFKCLIEGGIGEFEVSFDLEFI